MYFSEYNLIYEDKVQYYYCIIELIEKTVFTYLCMLYLLQYIKLQPTNFQNRNKKSIKRCCVNNHLTISLSPFNKYRDFAQHCTYVKLNNANRVV